MNIVTTTSVFPFGYPEIQALERLARLGYRHLDMAIDYCVYDDGPFLSDHWTDWAKALRERADALGVRYTHSHAYADAADPAGVAKSLQLTHILGAGCMVVHPMFQKPDGRYYESDDEFLSVNVPAARALLENAEKFGVPILSENLLWGASMRVSAIDALVREVNSPWFGWCYDTGHAKALDLSYRDLVRLSSVPTSLHIQDNHGRRDDRIYDDHLIPGDGAIDWKGFLDMLHEIGYRGDLVLEAHHQSLDAEDEDRDAILIELLRRTENMREYLESLS